MRKNAKRSCLAILAAFLAACGADILGFISMGAGVLALLAGSAGDLTNSANATCVAAAGDAAISDCNGVLANGDLLDGDNLALAAALRCYADSITEPNTVCSTGVWFKVAATVLADANAKSQFAALPADRLITFPTLTGTQTARVALESVISAATPNDSKGCTSGSMAQEQTTYMIIGFNGVDTYTLDTLIRETGFVAPDAENNSGVCQLSGSPWDGDATNDIVKITYAAGQGIAFDRDAQTTAESMTGTLTISFDNDSGGAAGFWGSTGTGNVTMTIDAHRSAAGLVTGSGICFSGTGATTACVPADLLVPRGAF